ncbi:PAS domain S-box protein [Pelomonas sp. KK5]|uniref:PAS domain S-box protein n=1 Tax=Pelomonas sp. KK5 TaxID=1855730 RepID=UPI00097CAC1C|nr:PAS domain S-box protein [Pelomonas sp. KK5]
MQATIQLLESLFAGWSLGFLSAWGRLAGLVGAVLVVCAYGRLTLRSEGRWRLARDPQAWDAQAFTGMLASFALVLLAVFGDLNFPGVEGLQPLGPVRGVAVFVCIALWGYPALVGIPPASLLAHLIGGVSPDFVADWLGGYFLWPAVAWMGRRWILGAQAPDFGRWRTWAGFAPFALLALLVVPAMWGWLCADIVGPRLAYSALVPKLLVTLLAACVLAPFVMLALLPLARRLGLLPAAGGAAGQAAAGAMPLRMALGGSLAAMVLAVSCAVALLALRSGEQGATKLAQRLNQELSDSIDVRLADYLEDAAAIPEAERLRGMSTLLSGLSTPPGGRALVLDRQGQVLAGSVAGAGDPVATAALAALREQAPALREPLDFGFAVLSERPLGRESWLARATPLADKPGRVGLVELTALPERYYLAELRAGVARAALVCAVSLSLAMLVAAGLAALVAAPTRRIIQASQALARGELDRPVPASRLAEMGALAAAFNGMARQLKASLLGSQRTSETLQGIFGASPVAIAVFRVGSGEGQGAPHGGELFFADINAAWERTTGHSREATIGRPGAALQLWMDMNVRLQFIGQMRELGRVRRLEARMRRADGSAYFAQVSGQDVRVGEERFNVVAIDDITAQKEASDQLQALNRQLGALLDAAVEVAVIATDAQGRVTVFNRGAERMLGYAAAELLGEPVLRVHLPDDIATQAPELALAGGAAFYAGQAQDGAARNRILRRKDGTPVQVSMALSTVRDAQGAVAGYLGIARDITEQLAAQAGMLELNTRLEQRVRERSQSLEAARSRLEQTMTHLQQMQGKLVQSEKLAGLGHIVAAVAHELNTPIGNCVTVASTLLGDTQSVSRDVAAGTLRKQRFGEYLAGMQSGTELLQRALQVAARLVNNFKRVADDAGGAERRQFDLREVIEDAVALLQPMLRKTPYRLDMELPAGIVMDSHPGALEQVLNNLVNNAVQHAFAERSHGRMLLRVERGEGRDGELVRLMFSDDGRGMSADTLARIYDPFFTTALGKGGSGLGMNISYKLVTAQLGGDIDVSSVLGQGSHFTLTLPLKAPEHAAASPIG